MEDEIKLYGDVASLNATCVRECVRECVRVCVRERVRVCVGGQ